MTGAAKSVMYRIGVDATDVKRAYKDDVEKAGVEAYGAIARASANATAAEEANVNRLIAAANRLEQKQKDRAAQLANMELIVGGASGKSASQSAAVFREAIAEDERREQAARRLRAELDPVWAAQQRLNAETAEYNALLKANKISEAERAAALALSRKRLEEVIEAERRGGNVISLRQARAARLNLARQVPDVFVSAAMGMNPGMIAIQQGPQILDAMAMSGMRLTPVMIGVGGAVAAVAGGAIALGAAWNDADKAQARFATSTYGLTRAFGLSAAEMRELAERSSKAGEISVRAARDLEMAYAGAGRIGADQTEKLIGLTKDYAAAMQMDLGGAAKDLASKFADPARGVGELNRLLGLFDQKTEKQIESMAKAGNVAGAQAKMYAALKDAIEGASEKTGSWSKAWDAVARSAANAWDWIGKAIDRQVGFAGVPLGGEEGSIADRRRGLEAAREASEKRLAANPNNRNERRVLDTLNEGLAKLDREERQAKLREQAGKNRADAIAAQGSTKTGGSGPTPADLQRAGEDALASARARELAARMALTENIDELVRLRREEIDTAYDERNADIRKAINDKRMREDLGRQAIAENEKARAAEKEKVDREALAEAAERDRQVNEAVARDMDITAGHQADLAKTLGERAAIERRVLDARHKREREELEADLTAGLATGRYNPSEAQGRRDAQAERQAVERDAIYQPVRDQFAAGLRDAFQAARGGSEGLADWFASRLEANLDRALDSLADQLSNLLFDSLSGAGSSGGKGGGGFAGKALGLGVDWLFGAGKIDTGGLKMPTRSGVEGLGLPDWTSRLPDWLTKGTPIVPQYAIGTDYAPGGWADVHQDERIFLPKGSQVWNPRRTREAMRAPAPIIHAPTIVHANDAVFASALYRQIEDARTNAIDTATAAALEQAPYAVALAQMQGRV